MDDPSGALLQSLASAMTGVDSSSHSFTLVDTHIGSDGGTYTSQDPGSYVCMALFLRGSAKIDTAPGADANSRLTADAVRGIVKAYPTYKEWFKVKKIGDKRYRLTLLPSSLQLSKEYSEEFSYP